MSCLFEKEFNLKSFNAHNPSILLKHIRSNLGYLLALLSDLESLSYQNKNISELLISTKLQYDEYISKSNKLKIELLQLNSPIIDHVLQNVLTDTSTSDSNLPGLEDFVDQYASLLSNVQSNLAQIPKFASNPAQSLIYILENSVPFRDDVLSSNIEKIKNTHAILLILFSNCGKFPF